MASPAMSTGSRSGSQNPFDRYQGETYTSSQSDESQHMQQSLFSSPPPVSHSPNNAHGSGHQLESAIPESPVEEEPSKEVSPQPSSRPTSSRKSSMVHQPSLLSQGAPSAKSRVPSTSAVSNDAPKAKKSLMRKFSGLNIFHHDAKHHPVNTAELKTNHASMHNTELKHPHTGMTSKPQDIIPVSPTARTPHKATFTVGDDASSPVNSNRPSRVPSLANASLNQHEGKSSTEGSPVRDHEDFIPRAPTRANSTFNFFRKNPTDPAHVPPARAASFHHGQSGPVSIPGVPSEDHHGAPMADLSRTLSKASLLGGEGWGNLTDRLPSFDALYTYKDAADKKINLDMHGKLGQIGEGAGGVIRTARLKPGKHPAYHPHSSGGDLGLFAVKTFRKQSAKESEGWYCQKLVREFRIHCALDHVNIVKLADICVEQKKFGDSNFVAVLDFCVGGDLFDLHYHDWNAIDQGVMSKVERNCVFKQLMYAVVYMHQQGIAHRDIKLENLLIDGHGRVKLADFGTSLFTRGADAEACRGIVGTEHSIPPEAFLSALHHARPAYDGLKADIWACAVTWHILTWSNDEPSAVLRAYPFGEDGADPDNRQWQKYMNVIKRYEPDRFIPGWDLYMDRKAEKAHSGTSPMVSGGGSGQGSFATSGASGQSELDQMFDTSDPRPDLAKDDLHDPLRRVKPFVNGFPGSGFTAAKGMLDPDPETRWTAQQVIEDPFFSLIECCQQDSNPHGYDSLRDRQRKGLQKVHNHIRPAARKLMEMNKVEQARNNEKTNAMRHA